MSKRKVLYITGTRADYGLMQSTLRAINGHPSLSLEVVVTGMHLMGEFGKTIGEVRKDGFKIHKINTVFEADNRESMSNFVGNLILGLTEKIKTIKPDILLLLGDRAEMLGAAVAGTYLSVPLAHIHGGDVTSTVDEVARHAITKLSHIHFPATKKSAERIAKMGEDPRRVFVVGAPGLDAVLNESLLDDNVLADKYKIKPDKHLILVVQHPVTAEIEDAGLQMEETMEVVKSLGYQTTVIYPNADAGGRKMIKVIESYKREGFIQAYKSVPRKDYLSLLAKASVLVGNSSSGIIESSSFHLPVVNIGTRQEGRDRSENVIDVGYSKKEIVEAVEKAVFDEKFKRKVERCRNPYGDGKASVRIAKVLSSIRIDNQLLNKKLVY